MRETNSVGNSTKAVRRFCRENGVKPTVANVERMQREVSRSQTDNERVERIAKETGRGGLRHPVTGEDMAQRVKRRVSDRVNGRR